MSAKLYTEEEVEQHNTKEDLWIIINSSVYDVTNYAEEHPGGELVLLQSAGQDATDEFEDNGHSEDARDLMVKYKIGDLAPSTGDKKIEPCRSCRWIQIGVVVATGVLMFAFWYKRRVA